MTGESGLSIANLSSSGKALEFKNAHCEVVCLLVNSNFSAEFNHRESCRSRLRFLISGDFRSPLVLFSPFHSDPLGT